jgi:hypothetical protein
MSIGSEAHLPKQKTRRIGTPTQYVLTTAINKQKPKGSELLLSTFSQQKINTVLTKFLLLLDPLL